MNDRNDTGAFFSFPGPSRSTSPVSSAFAKHECSSFGALPFEAATLLMAAAATSRMSAPDSWILSDSE